MPFPSMLSRNDLAALFNVESRTITNWVNAKPPVPSVKQGGRRMFRLPDVLAWYVARREEAVKPADLEEARARREAAQAELAELDLAERRGELTTVPRHLAVVDKLAARVRGVLLAMPPRYGPGLVGLADTAAVVAVLNAATHEMLADIQGDDDGRD